MKIRNLLAVLFGVFLIVGCGGGKDSTGITSSTSSSSSVSTSSSSSKESSATSSGTHSTSSSTSSSSSMSNSSSSTSNDVTSSTSSSTSSVDNPVIKDNPEIIFSISTGSTLTIGVDEIPTVTVTEGLEYEIHYEKDEKFYSSEFPTEKGTYAMVVTVQETEQYNELTRYIVFTLVEDKQNPEVTFSIESGTELIIGVDEAPTVTVTEGLEYEVHYEKDEKFYSSEFPTEKGTYAMVVTVQETEQFNSKISWIVFTLVEDKQNPEVTFSIESGTELIIGVDEAPTVTVTEGLEYEVHYEKDEKNIGNEFPIEPGIYSMVVNVKDNEQYNSKVAWVVFTLVEQQITPEPEKEYFIYVDTYENVKLEKNLNNSTEGVKVEYMGSIDLKVGDTITIVDAEGNVVEVWCENNESMSPFVVTVDGTHSVYYKQYTDGGSSLYIDAPSKPVDPTLEPITVYYTNPNNWTSVYAYSWTTVDGVTTETLGTWPGQKLSLDEETGYYKLEGILPGSNLIFNNGKEQTGNLVVPTTGENVYGGMWYNLDEPEPEIEYYRITFTLPNWDPVATNPRLYYWGSESPAGNLFDAGATSNMTLLEGNTYYIDIPSSVSLKGCIIIFEQEGQVKQSVDITNVPTIAGEYNITSDWSWNNGKFNATIENKTETGVNNYE